MSLSRRKQYAARVLLKGGPFTRTYDNCFEMGDGDEVVKYLMARAQKDAPLRAAIERQGTWDYWQYFANHGTYAGFTR